MVTYDQTNTVYGKTYFSLSDTVTGTDLFLFLFLFLVEQASSKQVPGRYEVLVANSIASVQ